MVDGSPPVAQEPPKRIVTLPALFLSTQSTIPRLTAILASFSLAMIAIAVRGGWESSSIEFRGIQLQSLPIAVALLGTAALLCIVSTEACVNSHGWDYSGLSSDRITDWNLPPRSDAAYAALCAGRTRLWHRIAVWCYGLGSMFCLLGLAIIFWPEERAISWVLLGYLGLRFVFALVCRFLPERALTIGDWFVRRVVGEP